ncbi:MAG: hypothetical protein ACE5FH_10170, partial [Candidatus Zixiibacteriota bacterium]
MKGGKLLKLFSKGAKKGSKSGGKKSGGGFSWPSGIRIGVFGHANSGKTVYFTVLNEDCKVARDFQLSVTDTVTAGEFLSNYRHLWGIGTATSVGTVVDLKGEKKFPDPTSSDKVLRFNAILHRKDKLPVVCYDYPGKTVEIAETGEAKEKLMDFMTHCQGLLFFFDPKMMAAELLCQQHVASFVNMLDTLAPAGSRLPIPVALVVSKADLLDGFSGEQQSILVSPEDENFLANDFELFLEKVLSSDTLSSSLTWSGSVRRVLVQLREFLKVVVGRTLDFQIFFMSSTGVTPEKVGTDVGRSLYIPPDKMQPIGVRHPFYWLFTSILRNRRISRMRTVAKYVTLISLIWIATFSTPFLYNLSFRLPRLFQEENGILIKYQGDPYKFSSKERSKTKRSYERYKNDFLIKMIFPEYWTPANDIYDLYFRGERDLAQTTADKELDKLTETFSAIVSDSGRWPNIEPATGEPSLG